MKKILILLPILFALLFGCSEEKNIFEPEVKLDSIDLPFESRENGKFGFIYTNNSTESIVITMAMVKSGEILVDSQNYDFCPDIINLRNNIANPNWTMINFNFPITSESKIVNKNDHPNLISYSFPKGTYLAFLMNAEGCDKNQYDVFDITSNDGLQSMGQ